MKNAKKDGTKTGLLDENGRLFGKLSIIDLMAAMLIAGLIIAVGYRFTSSAMSKDVNCQVRYVLMIEGVREFTTEYYQPGLACYDKLKQTYIGDISDVWWEPLTVSMTQLDGSQIIAEQPNRLRLFVEITADAAETDSAFLINGAYELKAGSQINLNTKYIDVSGIIVSAQTLIGD